MNRSILFIAFHYPPSQASSGLLRTLSFSKNFAQHGWRVSVLSAALRGDNTINPANESLIPAGIDVVRAPALDAARAFSIAGRYPGILELPDRYSTWIFSAIIAGFKQIKRNNIDAIFSTYPIASAHVVGWALSKLTGKPWVADFRDPMVMQGHPETHLRIKAHSWVEKRVSSACTAATFTSQEAMDSYQMSYPSAKTGKCRVIENGYDEEIFDQALRTYSEPKSTKYKAINIVHSGILYPDHRDPNPLFRAIKELKENWRTRNLTVTFSLRGAGYDDYYHELINSYGICEEVKLLSSIDYVSSVRELLGSDGLLLMQGGSCNAQIPAKIYEYFRVGKPVLALVDSAGATAKILSDGGISSVNFEDNAEELKQYIGEFCDAILNGTAERFTYTGDIETISRSYRSEQLRSLVEEVAYN